MTTLDLNYIRARSEHAAEYVKKDPCAQGGFLPLPVREHFDRDVPELIAEVERLRTVLAEIVAYAEERAAATEEVGDLFEASLTAIANNARQSIGDTRA